MKKEVSKPTPGWWLLLAVAAGCIVFMVIAAARSITRVLRDPAAPPPVLAAALTPDQEEEERGPGAMKPTGILAPAPLFPGAAAAVPRPPERKTPKENIIANFDQLVRAEREKKQVYQALREQAKANPGQPGTLTEEEIQKLEKEGETGDSGFP